MHLHTTRSAYLIRYSAGYIINYATLLRAILTKDRQILIETEHDCSNRNFFHELLRSKNNDLSEDNDRKKFVFSNN